MTGLVVLAMLLVPAAVAASEPVDSLLTGQELEPVVVTGTRTPKLLSKSPVLTRVISRSDIEKSDATDLSELLQQTVPGVEFSYAMNQMVHMNFSGFGGQSMLILVDGERLAGETMDDVDFSRLSMDNVDHIEIVRGAASALYGANAAGGVINIITKDKAKKFGLNVNGRLARHGSQRYGLTLDNAGSRWGNTLNIQRTASDNYTVSNGPDPVSRVINTIYGNKTWNFHDQASWKPTDNFELRGRAGYFFRQLTRTADTPERYRDYSAGLRALWNLGRGGNIDASYSFDQYDKSDYQRITSLDIRDYSNVQNAFRLVYTLPIGDDMLTAGADYMHDYLYNNKIEGETRHQDSFDAYAQYDWNITNRIEAVGALRYDYFSVGSVNRLTPKLSLRYEPIDRLNIRFGFGMGFRSPTLKEKYYNFDMAGIWTVQGNPDLKPEVSYNHNLSFDYTWRSYDFTVSGYYNRIRDKIGTGAPFYASASDNMPTLPYINLDDYRVYGFDATAQGRWRGGFSARVQYVYTNEQLPKNKNGQRVNNQYQPARKHSVNIHGEWTRKLGSWYKIGVAIDGRVYSSVDNIEFVDYYDVSKGTLNIHYPAYTLWKLSTSHWLGRSEAFKLTIAVDNLLNYEPKYHYLNAPFTDGANLMVGLSVDIDKL